jgi:hypothetical protein
MVGVPHEVVGDQLLTSFEGIKQGERSMRSDQLKAGVDFDHGQATSGRGDVVALVGVRFLAKAQLVKCTLEGGSIDSGRHRNFI